MKALQVTKMKMAMHSRNTKNQSARSLASEPDVLESKPTNISDLIRSYALIIERADLEHNKVQYDTYVAKLRDLCMDYRLVPESRPVAPEDKKKSAAEAQNELQARFEQFQQTFREWEGQIAQDLEAQDAALERRLLARTASPEEYAISTEATEQPDSAGTIPSPASSDRIALSKVSNRVQPPEVSAEVVMLNLEETVHQLNEDKAHMLSQLMESLAKEKYVELAKLEERYTKEIDKCKAPSSPLKAVLHRLTEKKETERKAIEDKYARKHADCINQMQSDYSAKLSELYSGLKKYARSSASPSHKSSTKSCFTPRLRRGCCTLSPAKTPGAGKRFVFPVGLSEEGGDSAH